MNILAVDPGPTTGFARWLDGKHRAWAEPLEDAQSTVAVACAGGLFELVVFEDFKITGETLKKTRDGMDSIEFIGVGRYLARRYNVPFETQMPSDAFGFSTNAKIKALGWVTPGPGDHAMSASKHLLLALVNHRAIDVAALARKVGVGL